MTEKKNLNMNTNVSETNSLNVTSASAGSTASDDSESSVTGGGACEELMADLKVTKTETNSIRMENIPLQLRESTQTSICKQVLRLVNQNMIFQILVFVYYYQVFMYIKQN